MNRKNKTLIKNIGLFTLGSFGSKILSFLLVPLYTAVLSTSEYGTVDLISSTASLLMPILLLSVFDATLRFGMDSTYKKADVLTTSLVIEIKGSFLLLIGIIAFSILFPSQISRDYLIFLFVYFVLGATSQIFNLYLKSKNQAAIIATSGIICTFITCASNIVFLLWLKFGIVGYMISNTCGVLFQILYQLFFGKIYEDIRFKSYSNLSKPMLEYSSPLISNSISWWVNNASDRYIVTFMRGVAENGIYSVAYKIPTILSVFQGIFYNAWSISAIKEFDSDDTDGFIGTNYSVYSFVSLIVCSGLLIINQKLAAFLYKGDYFVAWKSVPFLLFGTVFSGISQFEGSLFAAMKKTKDVAKTTIVGAGVNTLCNFIFVYYIGSTGAALATCLGYFVTWALRTKHIKECIHIKVNWLIHGFSIAIVLIQAVLATIADASLIQVVLFLILITLNKQYVMPLLNGIRKK